METVFHLHLYRTASGSLLCNMSDSHFSGHHSYFRKDYQIMIPVYIGHVWSHLFAYHTRIKPLIAAKQVRLVFDDNVRIVV